MDSCLAARSTASSFGFDSLSACPLRKSRRLRRPSRFPVHASLRRLTRTLGRTTFQPARRFWPEGRNGSPRFRTKPAQPCGLGKPGSLPRLCWPPRSGLSVRPEGHRHRQSWTGGLAFSGAWPCTFEFCDSFGGSLSDVPPGCPKGKSSDHHCFAETRKGVLTIKGQHAR